MNNSTFHYYIKKYHKLVYLKYVTKLNCFIKDVHYKHIKR